MNRSIYNLLAERYTYNPLTGEIKNNRTKLVKSKKDKDGYIQALCVELGNSRHYVKSHRFAWFMITGEVPLGTLQIDHKDRDRSNNKHSNLRLATIAQNRVNSTHKGVSFKSEAKGHNKFEARLRLNGKYMSIGYFASYKIASAFYDSASSCYYKEFSNSLRKPRNIDQLRSFAKWFNLRYKKSLGYDRSVVLSMLKKGISPAEISRDFDIPYKTVYSLKSRILCRSTNC